MIKIMAIGLPEEAVFESIINFVVEITAVAILKV